MHIFSCALFRVGACCVLFVFVRSFFAVPAIFNLPSMSELLVLIGEMASARPSAADKAARDIVQRLEKYVNHSVSVPFPSFSASFNLLHGLICFAITPLSVCLLCMRLTTLLLTEHPKLALSTGLSSMSNRPFGLSSMFTGGCWLALC